MDEEIILQIPIQKRDLETVKNFLNLKNLSSDLLSCKDFLEHRLEHLLTIMGIRWRYPELEKMIQEGERNKDIEYSFNLGRKWVSEC